MSVGPYTSVITTGLLNEESMLILGTDADVLVGKSLSVGGGYEYSQQQLVGTTHAFYALVAFPLTKWLRFETRGRFNQFASNDPSAYPGHNEIVATGSLRAQW